MAKQQSNYIEKKRERCFCCWLLGRCRWHCNNICKGGRRFIQQIAGVVSHRIFIAVIAGSGGIVGHHIINYLFAFWLAFLLASVWTVAARERLLLCQRERGERLLRSSPLPVRIARHRREENNSIMIGREGEGHRMGG